MCSHASSTREIFFCLLLFVFFFTQNIAAQECCDIPGCNAEAISYANSFTTLTATFGEAPSGRDSTLARLNRIKSADRMAYDEYMSKISEYKTWSDSHNFGTNCFALHALGLPDGSNTVGWVNETVSSQTNNKYRSSQFCRGFRFQLEGGLGAANLGQQSESFYSTLRALLSYTFAPTDPATSGDPTLRNCNGRIRVLTGLSEAYISGIGITQGLLRAEIRLSDINTMVGAVANFKLILQGSQGITRNMTSYGGGLGLEVEFGGLNLLYERHNRFANSSIELNMAYQF